MNRPMFDKNAHWYLVSVPHFTCAVVELDGRIIEAAPIMRWAIGKSLGEIKRWAANKRGIVNTL